MFSLNIALRNLCQLLLPLLLLTACSGSKVDKASDAASATFFVDKIEGSSVISKIDPSYSIPEARLYNFKACLKDIMQSKAIQGQLFRVEGSSPATAINSDEQGCLNWSETINFNFLAPSSYVQLTRNIVALGIHKGSFNIHVVLNPWAHGEDTTGVIDPSKQTVTSLVSENKATSALTADGVKSPLWAIDPRAMIMQKEFTSSGASMLLKFQSKISLILKNSASQNIQYQINTGNFDVEMVLYNSVIENGKEILMPLANGIKSNATFSQDTLIAEFPFNLNALPNRGQILMGVKITAPNNQVGLEPFEGVFLVSDDYNIKADRQLSLVTTQSYKEVQQKLVSSNVSVEEKKSLAKPGIEIDKLDIKFFKIGSENTTIRQVFFNIKACMKSNLDNKPIRNEAFNIKTVANSKAVTLISNQDGCVSWDDSIQHKFFGNEHFIKSSVNITNAAYNLNSKINILLNPWDSGSNFGRDARFVDDLGSIAVNPSSENAKIIFENYNFNVLNYKYEINRNLDLSLIKNGTLSLSARVAKHSSFSDGRMGNEMLRDGQYLLKWAVVSLDNNQKVDCVISTGQKLITTLGGDIKTDVAFKVDAFEKLGQKSRLIVALYTVKEKKLKNKTSVEIDRTSGLEATPYVSPIVLNNDQDGQKMTLLDASLGLGNGDVFDRLSALKSDRNMTMASALIQSVATDAVMAKQNLKKINLSNEKESLLLRDGLANPNKYYTITKTPAYYHEQEQRPALSSAILSNLARTGKLSPDLAAKFCHFWFNDYLRRLKPDSKSGALIESTIIRMNQNCLDEVKKDPSHFFSVDKKIMVKQVGNIKYKKGTTNNLSVGNTFSVAKTEATSVSKNWSWTTTAGLGLNLFEVFKIGTTGSYAVSKSSTKSNTINNSVQVNETTGLLIQTSTFDVELSTYEECSSIRLNPNLFIGKNALYGNIWINTLRPEETAKIATSGFFICTGVNNNTPIIKEESYYLVSQDNTYNRGEQDAYAPENNTLFMTFRGQRDLSAFLNLIQGSVKRSDEKGSTFSKSEMTNDFLTKLPSWPGAYSEAIISN